MLLNVGGGNNPTAMLTALALAAIEEAGARGSMTFVDAGLRWLRGLPPLGGPELELQRLVWMCEINQSAIAELSAIVITSVMYIVMEPHRWTFSLGYVPGVVVAAGPVFVQLLLELGLEICVDNVAMLAEAEHGIEVTKYFQLVRSPVVYIFHAAMGAMATAIGLYCVIRHPIV